MIVSVEQVKIGIANFIEREIAMKSTGFQKFLSYFAIPLVDKTVSGYMSKFMENAVTSSFFDNNGNVKLDELYNMAKSAVQKSGQFTVYGIILGETDIDKIYNYIQNTII